MGHSSTTHCFLAFGLLVGGSMTISYAQEAVAAKPKPTTSSETTLAMVKIKALLTTQSKQWNEGDLEGFMQTYWNSEKLTFSSGGKTTRGWQATLNNYKKRYQSAGKEMGHLTFDQLQVDVLSPDVALALGNWHLKMTNEADNIGGNFSLVMKLDAGQWKIIHDHSSKKERKSD